MRKQPKKHDIKMKFEGKTYTATYYVASGAVTLESSYGTTSTHAGSSAKFTARMLFREILDGQNLRAFCSHNHGPLQR